MGLGRKSPLYPGPRGFKLAKSPQTTQALAKGRSQRWVGLGRKSSMLTLPLKYIPHIVGQPWRETKRHQRNKRMSVSLLKGSRAVTVCPEVPLHLHGLFTVGSVGSG